jgi:hypothetical protein
MRHRETKENLINEEEIIKFASQYWNVNYIKMPIQYKLDYAITKKTNEVIAFCEVKKRTCSIFDYKTYIISLAKLQAGRQLASLTNTKSILIIGWNDVIGYVDFNVEFKTIIGGRKDRNDWQDQEPMAEIDILKFKKLNRGS